MAKVNGRKSLPILSAAERWLERGIVPVPLRPKSKKPAAGDGWNKLILKKGDLPRYFKNGSNVGGLWGKPSGWVVDLDLDSEPAAIVAEIVLPETFAYGRGDRPRTHYLFRANGIKTMKFADPISREVIVEIRSTGSQSVLPPSKHPTGDLYEIDEDNEIRELSPGKLERYAGWIAGVAVLSQYYPKKGSRHDFIHAFAGSMLHLGASGEDVKKLSLALIAAAGDKETAGGDRKYTVENTIANHEKSRTQGWKTLKEFLPDGVAEKIRPWFKFTSNGAAGPIVVRKAPKPDPGLKRPDLTLPGLVGEIAKWNKDNSYVIQPLFDLAVGLWTTALLTGNRYKVGSGFDTPLQPYFMLLAPTAGGKENAHRGAFNLAKRLDLRDHVFSGFQSYHVLADKVAEVPSTVGWLWDEAARKLKSSGNPHSQDYQILTWLMKLYGQGCSSTPGLPARNESSAVPSIDFPFLSVLATAQPGPFIEAISGQNSAFDTGLMNRFVLFDAGDDYSPRNYHRQQLFPKAIKTYVEKIRELPQPLEDRPQRSIKLDTGEWQMFREFDEESSRKAAGGTPIDTLWGRANQNALILAGTIAVGLDPKHPRITSDLGEWAIEFIRWTIDKWSRRMEGQVASNFTEARSKQLEQYVRNSPKYAARATNPGWRKLLADGKMPIGFLGRLSRAFRGRERTEMIEDLVEIGILGTGTVEIAGDDCEYLFLR